MSFARELADHIKAHGPLTVADYMQRCNAHYYATRDPLGPEGDFITAPEISQIFGELVGAWMVDQWHRLGKPNALLCELGPGRGTLMKDALRATKNVPGFHDALDLRLVETSPVLRQAQERKLKEAHPRIGWQQKLDTLPSLPLLLIANEFFDALPVRQFVRVNLEETERFVTHDGKNYIWQPEVAVAHEDSPLSQEIMQAIALHIRTHGGAALIIDYGYTNGEQGETLQAVRAHKLVKTLEHPGEADLTAHVDFSALAHAAQNNGAYVHGPVTQGLFLKRLGAELRAIALCKSASVTQQESIASGLERLVSPEQMGELFKVMAVTDTLDKPAGF